MQTREATVLDPRTLTVRTPSPASTQGRRSVSATQIVLDSWLWLAGSGRTGAGRGAAELKCGKEDSPWFAASLLLCLCWVSCRPSLSCGSAAGRANDCQWLDDQGRIDRRRCGRSPNRTRVNSGPFETRPNSPRDPPRSGSKRWTGRPKGSCLCHSRRRSGRRFLVRGQIKSAGAVDYAAVVLFTPGSPKGWNELISFARIRSWRPFEAKFTVPEGAQTTLLVLFMIGEGQGLAGRGDNRLRGCGRTSPIDARFDRLRSRLRFRLRQFSEQDRSSKRYGAHLDSERERRRRACWRTLT